MNIKTDTPLVKKAREGVMEFLLVGSALYCNYRCALFCLKCHSHAVKLLGVLWLRMPSVLCRSTTRSTVLSAIREESVICRIRSALHHRSSSDENWNASLCQLLWD